MFGKVTEVVVESNTVEEFVEAALEVVLKPLLLVRVVDVGLVVFAQVVT